MSQHVCVSGSSARSMSLASCLSIHVYLRILCKIHVSKSISQQQYVSQDPLQDPRLRTHVSASLYLTDSLQDPCLRIHVSASLYLIISQDPLQDPCLRIHVSGSCLSIHQYGSFARSMSPDSCLSIFVSQDSLQDPCLRIHVSASTNMEPLQDPRLRIHVSASICISGSSARSMSPDPNLSIHIYLRILCKIHVSGSMSPSHVSASTYLDPVHDPCISIHVSASLSVDPLQDPYLSIEACGSCTKSTRRAFCVALCRENAPIEILCSVSRRQNAHFDLPDAFFVALRRRNANFDLPRRISRKLAMLAGVPLALARNMPGAGPADLLILSMFTPPLVTLRSWVQPPLRPPSQKQWYLQCFLHYMAVKPR